MAYSKKCLLALDAYLDWVKCPAPLGEHAARFVGTKFVFAPEGVTAKEGLYQAETHGKFPAIREDEYELAQRYIHGKANKDWWNKEIGWWNKNAVFCPEEFLGRLTPECFMSLFGHPPRTHMVRYWHDDTYTWDDFVLDTDRLLIGLETVPGGVQVIRQYQGAL